MKTKQQTIRMLEKRLDNNVARAESFGKKLKPEKCSCARLKRPGAN